MRIVNLESKVNVVVTKWESGNGKMPAQAQKSEIKYDVTLNKQKVTVYHNVSKSGIKYYYAQIDGVWMWSRDEFVQGKYETYVKQVTVKDPLLKSSAAQEMGLEAK